MISRLLPSLFGLLIVTLLAACTGNPANVHTWGGLGDGSGQFNEPFDVAVDQQGDVYVTDVRNKRVQKFTADGDFILAFGQALFEKPAGIATGQDGTIWVTDYDLDRILHFDGNGQLIAVWGEAGEEPGLFASPVDVAVNSSGLVYVVDQYHHRIQQFTPEGLFIRNWGRKGKVNVVSSALNFLRPDDHEDEFYYPSRIAIGSDDRVYVSDSYNNRVQVFTSEGDFLQSIGGMGLWGSRFRISSGLVIAADNSIFVADFYNNRIQHFDQKGHFISAWGGADHLNGPTGVALTPDGSVVVADWGNHRIQQFSPRCALVHL
ncbi:tripartite motif-containing protein 71 [Mariprofundus micogutta]|uniref:Tripartite motif-containing protein 71 n=1 Tax=Mariprofundus micogutta TaxID=1921010 RepID=A0A1L8CP48_9PROT|nr:NHL repeat-containing protein [Mariprofundus micogutta]GAV20678.1 tripartite motif-containing protein 71 [Mariprofundus micogutta]